MNYPIVYALARNCVPSDLNVRTESDPEADAELEAMIGEAGFVLQNLIGTPVKRKKEHYSIFGGGRRLAGVHRLIEKGKLSADFCVPVMVLPDAKDAIELSLAENQKLPMTAADECTAFHNMIEKEGKIPAQIAARFGKTERFVLGRIRLANLAGPIFEALRKGEISLEVAQAYASTSDIGFRMMPASTPKPRAGSSCPGLPSPATIGRRSAPIIVQRPGGRRATPKVSLCISENGMETRCGELLLHVSDTASSGLFTRTKGR